MWIPPSHYRSAFLQVLERRRNQFTSRSENDRGIQFLRRFGVTRARPFGSQFSRKGPMPLVARECEHARTPIFRNLDRDVRRRAESIKSERLAAFDFRNAQTTKSDDARTQQRRSLQILKSVRQFVDEVFARDDVFRVAAVDCVAGKSRCVAQIFFA